MAQASSYPTKSPVASDDKVLVLDGAASNAIKQATLADVRQLGTYRQTFTIANNASQALFGGNAFAGIVVVANDTAGPMAVFLVDYFAVNKILDTSGAFAVAAGTAGKNNVYKSGIGQPVNVENKYGATAAFSVLIVPLGAT